MPSFAAPAASKGFARQNLAVGRIHSAPQVNETGPPGKPLAFRGHAGYQPDYAVLTGGMPSFAAPAASKGFARQNPAVGRIPLARQGKENRSPQTPEAFAGHTGCRTGLPGTAKCAMLPESVSGRARGANAPRALPLTKAAGRRQGGAPAPEGRKFIRPCRKRTAIA